MFARHDDVPQIFAKPNCAFSDNQKLLTNVGDMSRFDSDKAFIRDIREDCIDVFKYDGSDNIRGINMLSAFPKLLNGSVSAMKHHIMEQGLDRAPEHFQHRVERSMSRCP